MDVIDRKIIAIIGKDSALTAENLGMRVGLSPSAAHRRLRALEASGDILGYRARLSPSARGNPSTVFVAVTLIDQRQQTLQDFEQAIASHPIVSEAHLMSGESDYLIKLLIRADDSYERVHREILSALPGVQRLVSQFTIRTLTSAD
jgi:Lrp/AsnC family transcriptional regulator, leucine-responsive regulatory protein